MENKIYIVIAYRWGDTNYYSYPVALYSGKQLAIDCADKEHDWRGGKYECIVYSIPVDKAWTEERTKHIEIVYDTENRETRTKKETN